jgi:type IV pilus assembly protein PilY1
VVTGTTGSPATPRCRKKFDRGQGYVYPRYGRFTRTDVVSTTGSYPRGPNSVRTDCAAASCTYAEEIQNVANWWGYYRTRMELMKTATGRAFLTIDDRYRVGFITINPNSPVAATKFVAVGQFNAAQRTSFYTRLYAQSTNGSTPLREALSRVGRYYAGMTNGISAGMGADPMLYSCQTNYALLTTDGYWNSNSGQNIAGGGVGNQDNSNSGFTTRGAGAYDGNLASASDTLADVAAYYYQTDLRTTGALAPNNVPTSQKDTAAHQHMVTFGLGLGLEGLMDYVQDYETNAASDFAKIKAGGAGTCSWTTGTCDWPVPVQNDPSTLDDLWHAAVNGRGTYFSASDPNSLAQGLQSALAKLKVQTAAAAASATSSPNITQTDNFIYSSTFRTAVWDGEIVAQRIDIATGNIIPAIVWSAQSLLDGRTSTNADSRLIYTIDESGANKRKNFTYATLSSTAAGAILPEQPYFASKCGALGQCVLLTMAQQAIANSGTNLVNYLRGQREFEGFTAPETSSPFRLREHVLGDTVNATPVYVRVPSFGYTDAVVPTYEDYKLAQDTRQGVLYVAANDGMLHAFAGDTGQELWAYIPRMVMPNMHKLANTNWGATHRFSVDGSPTTADVFTGGAWKTVLVAGLNSGGRGYYALDVTDPANPKVLWEICSDATVCQKVDADMGFSYGNAEIGKRAFDDKWVVYVTSGINNVSPGNGQGYLYTLDLDTGTVLTKTPTGVGSVAAPVGMNRIAAFADNPFTNNKITKIYGGDLWGNVWKFDTTTASPTVTLLATLQDGSGRPQSITTRPELAVIKGFPVVYVGTGRYLGTDDLVDPALLVPAQPFAYNNSLYAIKDKGTSYGNFRLANVVVNTLLDGGTTRTSSNNPVDFMTQDGWYVDLNPGGTSPGERINLDPQLVLGTLVVVGNVPNNTVCTVGGDAFVYFFDYGSGRAVPSSAGGITGYKITGQTVVGFVIFSRGGAGSGGAGGGGGGGGGGSGVDCYYTGATGEKIRYQCPIGGGGGKARRTSWRELIQQ